MAVIKTISYQEGVPYCLVLDALADTAAVVAPWGFTPDEDGNVEFKPAYYSELSAGDWGDILLRITDEDDEPCGFMLEHVSMHQPRHSSLEVIEALLTLAYDHFPAVVVEEGPAESPVAPVIEGLRQANGKWEIASVG